MNVHPQARIGFQRTARAYTRGRPSYPEAAIAWLVDRLALAPGVTVLDVGAGTGKLTEALMPSGASVQAVEPVNAMREELARRLPAVTVLDGTAEALPVDAPVDAITVGQAFHWFDGPAALREFHRVLRPGGRAALVWNVRDRDQPVWRALEPVIEAHRGRTPQHGDGRWRGALTASDLFRAAGELHVPHVQEVDRASLTDRVGSTSYIAALPDDERSRVLELVRAVAAGEPDPIALRYTTEVYLLQRVG